jgi:hypothetical protein
MSVRVVSGRALRPIRGPRALLRIGDEAMVRVDSFAGGEPFAEVINEPGGLLPYAKKHLGPVQYADLEVQVPVDAHPELFQWIGDAWFGNPLREEVALDAFEPLRNTGRTLELRRTRMHEVVLPRLGVSLREEAPLTLRITPQSVQRTAGASAFVEAPEPTEFRAHNFAVEIDGIDCTGVLGVEPMTVQTSEGNKLVFPDIHLDVDDARADAFREWFDDFVIAGNNDDDKEREGAITLFDPLLERALARLELRHIGIWRMGEPESEAGGASRVRVDLYCERMELKKP